MENLVKILLGLTSVAGLAVIVWRLWMLRWEKVVPAALVDAVSQTRPGEDAKELRAVCEKNPSPLGRLLQLAADHRDWPKADNVLTLETAARHEVVKLERGLVVLEIIVGIAPLLGLVGTIIGMIGVFGDIGNSGLNTPSDAGKLASGISYILWATLFGLLISIPSLVAWSYFSKKVEVLAVEMEALCDQFIRKQYTDKK
jgi:biopolymer transport protein ExbB